MYKKQELLGGELLGALRRNDLQGAAVQNGGSHRQPAVRAAAIPPQQRLDAPEHLLLVHGLYHVVIGACPKAAALVLLRHPGRHHQHRQVTVSLPQRLGEGDAVHPRHGDVHHRQIALVVLHHLQRLHTVPGGAGLVSRPPQHLAHQKAGAVAVLNYQNTEHDHPSSVFSEFYHIRSRKSRLF